MSACRGCGSEIVWAKSKSSDRSIPLDAGSKQKRAAVVSLDERGSPEVRIVDTYIPHHATCPNADQFRKQRVHS
jgi:hypothetical protein